jgi:hypothetical protein
LFYLFNCFLIFFFFFFVNNITAATKSDKWANGILLKYWDEKASDSKEGGGLCSSASSTSGYSKQAVSDSSSSVSALPILVKDEKQVGGDVKVPLAVRREMFDCNFCY